MHEPAPEQVLVSPVYAKPLLRLTKLKGILNINRKPYFECIAILQKLFARGRGMFRQIQYFQAVVQNNSFSAAAEKCHISQSAISQQIQALERGLGVTLLRRQNRRFSLTPAGEHFYQKSLLLTADYDRLLQETRQIARGEEFTLRVGYLKGYGGTEFQRAVAAFTSEYPDVPVDVVGGNHEDLYDLLRRGDLDLVLNDQRRAFSDEYVNEVLCVVGCMVELPARDPLAARECVDVGDLRRIPCILISSREQQKTEQEHYHGIYGIISEFLFAENLEEARLMVLGGKGFLPIEGGAQPAQFTETIRRLVLCRGGRPIRRNYCAFWKADNSGYYVESFAAILKKQFGQTI